MLQPCNGKLFVYASSSLSKTRRLAPVRTAAERMARRLRLDFEVKTFKKKFAPIYVYYANGDDEPVPIYCVSEGQSNIDEICTTLRNMMFVLSFHPKHSALRQIRSELIQFS
jgi:hypothetical protein